jgi:hypothetical protein
MCHTNIILYYYTTIPPYYTIPYYQTAILPDEVGAAEPVQPLLVCGATTVAITILLYDYTKLLRYYYYYTITILIQ